MPMLFLINSEDETIFEDYFKRNNEIIKQINLLIIMGSDGYPYYFNKIFK